MTGTAIAPAAGKPYQVYLIRHEHVTPLPPAKGKD